MDDARACMCGSGWRSEVAARGGVEGWREGVPAGSGREAGAVGGGIWEGNEDAVG